NIKTANKIGLQAKHLIHYDEDFNAGDNPIAQVNQLALHNLKGNRAPFKMELEDGEAGNDLLDRAILRNQWSNYAEGDISQDLALIDTFLDDNLNPAVEEDLRETRVIRSLQQDFINESLKHINGLAFQFPKSAGFYHSMAASVL